MSGIAKDKASDFHGPCPDRMAGRCSLCKPEQDLPARIERVTEVERESDMAEVLD